MIYNINGHFLSGLGFMPQTVTESQRQAEVAKTKNAAWYASIEKNKQQQAAVAAMSFDQLEDAVFMKDPTYGKFAKLFPRDERYSFWVEAGKPRQAVPVINKMSKVSGKLGTIAKRVAEAKQAIASSAVLQAAAQAVQTMQAANPQYSQAALIASAAKAVQARPGTEEPVVDSPVVASPLTADAGQGTVGSGVAVLGLAAVGLFLFKAAI